MTFKKGNPGCPCCGGGSTQPPYQCFRCQTDTRGSQVQVVLYGVTTGAFAAKCPTGECDSMNGTYILDYPEADGCAAVWYSTGSGGSQCYVRQIDFFPGSLSTFGDWTIQVDAIANPVIPPVGGSGGGVVNYSPSLGASGIDCSSWSSENAPYYLSFNNLCRFTTSNCTISSITT